METNAALSAAGLTPTRLAWRGKAPGAMLCDSLRLGALAGPTVLDPDSYGTLAQPVQERGGRQAAWFVQGDHWDAVLRVYRRGGWVARWSQSAYLWLGEAHTRPFREFRLLAWMGAQGLAVPAPLAAGYWRDGLTYRAAILVERIPDVQPLARNLSDAACVAAGQAIAAMHVAGVWHADLNAFNVLLDATNRAWLIDFDRGRAGGVTVRGRRANLLRLRRSLVKVAGPHAGHEAWARIRQAYERAQ